MEPQPLPSEVEPQATSRPDACRLDYAGGSGRLRERRLAMADVAVLVLGIALALAWPRWVGPYVRQARYLNRQHQCMAWSLPADRVVYEGDGVAAASLVASGAGYRHPIRPPFHTPDNGPPAGWGPPAY